MISSVLHKSLELMKVAGEYNFSIFHFLRKLFMESKFILHRKVKVVVLPQKHYLKTDLFIFQ